MPPVVGCAGAAVAGAGAPVAAGAAAAGAVVAAGVEAAVAAGAAGAGEAGAGEAGRDGCLAGLDGESGGPPDVTTQPAESAPIASAGIQVHFIGAISLGSGHGSARATTFDGDPRRCIHRAGPPPYKQGFARLTRTGLTRGHLPSL